MAQHHVHWGIDTKYLAAAALLLYLITRPKKKAAPVKTQPTGDNYIDANRVTWSIEQPAGTPLPVPYWIAQALDGAYAGEQVGPAGNVPQLRALIENYAAAHKPAGG